MRRLFLIANVILLPVGLSAQETDAEAKAKVEVGKPAPDFTVTGIDGGKFKLSDKTKTGKNVALMFSRAHW